MPVSPFDSYSRYTLSKTSVSNMQFLLPLLLLLREVCILPVGARQPDQTMAVPQAKIAKREPSPDKGR